MTQHLHAAHVPGCYRCELSREEIFDEVRLLADVVKQWGEYGAHADVLRSLIAERDAWHADAVGLEP